MRHPHSAYPHAHARHHRHDSLPSAWSKKNEIKMSREHAAVQLERKREDAVTVCCALASQTSATRLTVEHFVLCYFSHFYRRFSFCSFPCFDMVFFLSLGGPLCIQRQSPGQITQQFKIKLLFRHILIFVRHSVVHFAGISHRSIIAEMK